MHTYEDSWNTHVLTLQAWWMRVDQMHSRRLE